MCVANMQDPVDYAPFKLVRSRITQYYPCTVDLRWQRSIHSCDSCPYQQTQASNNPVSRIAICGAIHYGHCTSVKKITSPMVSSAKGIPPFPAISISRPVPRSPAINTSAGTAKSPPVVKVTPKFPLVTITRHGNVISVNQRKVNISNPLTVAKVAPRISTVPGVKVAPKLSPVNISNVFHKIPVESYPRIVPRTPGSGGAKVHHIPIQRIPSKHGAHIPQTDHLSRHIAKPQLPVQTVRPQLPVPLPRPTAPSQHNIVRPQLAAQVIDRKDTPKALPVISVSSAMPNPPTVTIPVVTTAVIAKTSVVGGRTVIPIASVTPAVTRTTATVPAPVTATVSLPHTRNTIHIKPQVHLSSCYAAYTTFPYHSSCSCFYFFTI